MKKQTKSVTCESTKGGPSYPSQAAKPANMKNETDNAGKACSTTTKSCAANAPPPATAYKLIGADECGTATWSPLMDGLVPVVDADINAEIYSFFDSIINWSLYLPKRARLPVCKEISDDDENP